MFAKFKSIYACQNVCTYRPSQRLWSHGLPAWVDLLKVGRVVDWTVQMSKQIHVSTIGQSAPSSHEQRTECHEQSTSYSCRCQSFVKILWIWGIVLLVEPIGTLETPTEARDAKGAPLLAQHINSMDVQGTEKKDTNWIAMVFCWEQHGSCHVACIFLRDHVRFVLFSSEINLQTRRRNATLWILHYVFVCLCR